MAVPSVVGPKAVFQAYMSKLQEITAVLERAFVNFSSKNGYVIQPVRSAVKVDKHNGLLLTMPAYSKSDNALTTKLVTVYPDNAKRNLPAIQANVLLFDSETGSLKCMIDGNILTALRTAHASAIATKHLVNSANMDILTILGAGIQAKSHIQIFSALFPFKEIRIWNHRPETANKLASEMLKEGKTVEIYSTIEEAVKNADVIVTATLSTVPLLMAHWIKTGAHINSVGACDPTWQELDEALTKSATIYVDSRDAALVESGDIILSKATIHAEIGDVIAQKVKVSEGSTTIFKSLGMAIEDTVTANIVYQHCKENNTL